MLEKARLPRAEPRRKASSDERRSTRVESGTIGSEVRIRDLQTIVADQARRLSELSHRTKNNLQTLSAIAILKARHSQDDATRRALLEMAERIAALSTTYRPSEPASDDDRVDASALVAEVAHELLSAVDDARITLDLALEPIAVRAGAAAPFALLVNELVGSALRQGFPDGRRGRLKIALCGADGATRLVIAHDGIALDAARAGGDAFGRTLCEMFARQIGAELSFEDAQPGTRAVVLLRES
jgi:two-component sensor histidine kinase